MLVGFLDDTEIVVDPEDTAPDVFVFGGYFIRQDQLHDLQRRVIEVKAAYDLPGHAPVKWNLRDTSLINFYVPKNLLDPNMAAHLLKISFEVRHDLLALLHEFDARILISGRYDVSWREPTHSEYYQWAFENLLQRVGLMASSMGTIKCDTSSTMLIVDWPQRGVDKSLFDIYMGGFHYGNGISSKQNYYSGPLSQFRFIDSIAHGSTLHSGPLQVSDLIVGCCRDFLSWAFKGTRVQKIEGLFELLVDQFYRDDSGRLGGCGFKVAKANQLDVEAKIAEYLHLTRKLDDVDISF